MIKQTFPAKILLFGEHAVLKGGKALSIPYHKYSGGLDIPNNSTIKSRKSNALLKAFVEILKSKNVNLNFKKIDHDIHCGMAFDSSIPLNYGLGSSGALVAAFYSEYFDNNPRDIDNWYDLDIKNIQSQLAILESCFHGQSSGFDPLVCLFAEPMLYQNQEIEFVSQNQSFNEKFFIIDSELQSNTQKWVNKMMALLKNFTFESQFKEQFIVASDLCIDSFLGSNAHQLTKRIKALSQTTLNLLDFLIPESFKSLCGKGIETDNYYLKLCGSGGGGFILGYTDDWNKLKALQRNYKIEPIFSSVIH